jgi:hypothetical protein
MHIIRNRSSLLGLSRCQAVARTTVAGYSRIRMDFPLAEVVPISLPEKLSTRTRSAAAVPVGRSTGGPARRWYSPDPPRRFPPRIAVPKRGTAPVNAAVALLIRWAQLPGTTTKRKASGMRRAKLGLAPKAREASKIPRWNFYFGDHSRLGFH